jgi:chromate reductase
VHHPIRILGISGSLRTKSYNTALLGAVAEAMPPSMSVRIVDIGDLPLYNRDVEVQGLPGPVSRLRSELSDADAVLFACPEYNWSVTGALKNAIDWLSRNPASPLDHKPAAIVGGGGRGGGARAQAHLREVLAHNRVDVYEESEVVVPRVWGAFDDDLRLTDDHVRADVRTLVAGLEAHVHRDIVHRPALVAVGADGDVLAAPYRRLIADYRVSLSIDAESLSRQLDRWSPVAVVVADDRKLDEVAVPVVRIDDPEKLLDQVAEAIER